MRRAHRVPAAGSAGRRDLRSRLAVVSPARSSPGSTELIADGHLLRVTLPVSAVVGVIDACSGAPLSDRAAGAPDGCRRCDRLVRADRPSAWRPVACHPRLPVAIFGAAGAWLCAVLADGPGLVDAGICVTASRLTAIRAAAMSIAWFRCLAIAVCCAGLGRNWDRTSWT